MSTRFNRVTKRVDITKVRVLAYDTLAKAEREITLDFIGRQKSAKTLLEDTRRKLEDMNCALIYVLDTKVVSVNYSMDFDEFMKYATPTMGIQTDAPVEE